MSRLLKNPVIETLFQEILKDHINYMGLEKKLQDFRAFLLKITSLDLNDQNDRKDMQFDNGIALSTIFAALCTHDLMRTRQFIRGIYQAIQDVQNKQSEPVHLLYAGTGPFATLILPILTRLSSTEIRLHLMDVNEATLEYLNKVIQKLSIEDYVEEIICADATIHQFDHAQQFDILVSETMQHGLVKEQQVPIMINLVSQLPESTIVIPSNIRLDLALKNSSTHLMFENKPEQIYKTLTRLWDFTPKFMRSVGKKNTRFELCRNIDFSEEKEAYHKLVVLTSIQVYKEEWIQPDLSGLTIPRDVLQLSEHMDKKYISLSYQIQAQPDFEVELS